MNIVWQRGVPGFGDKRRFFFLQKPAGSSKSVDRVPVVDRSDPKRMVGIISTKDILAVDELTRFWRERRQ